MSKICNLSKWKYPIGIGSLVYVVISWVICNFIIDHILQTYNKPLFATFISCCSLQLFFIFLVIRDPFSPKKLLQDKEERENIEKLKESTNEIKKSPISVPVSVLNKNSNSTVTANATFLDEETKETESMTIMKPFTLKQTALLALGLYPLYSASLYLMTLSFAYTSVGSSTILAATCGFFTLIISYFAKIEDLSLLKCIAVLTSTGGVLYLGREEFKHPTAHTIGNIYSLTSAILYGGYSTFLKKVTKDESRVSMPILFAFVGLYTMLTAWPILLIAHLTGMEKFELPTRFATVGLLAINAFFGSVIPGYLWGVSFLFTGPLIVAIGISFNIPLTLLAEYFWKGLEPESYKILSGICIIIGFLIVNVAILYPNLDIKLTNNI